MLSLSLSMQGIFRPPHLCKQRFRQITVRRREGLGGWGHGCMPYGRPAALPGSACAPHTAHGTPPPPLPQQTPLLQQQAHQAAPAGTEVG